MGKLTRLSWIRNIPTTAEGATLLQPIQDRNMTGKQDNRTTDRKQRLILRISQTSLSFSAIDSRYPGQIRFEPYTMKSGISPAANLRQAFKENSLLQDGYERCLVLIDSPYLLIPIEEFKKEEQDTLYRYTLPGHRNDVILSAILPDLNAVVVFSLNKDLKVVMDDHFKETRFLPLMQPVWQHLHRRSFTGMYGKLYGYFHDRKLEITVFGHTRFKFYNAFDVRHGGDAVYFLLYVWRQLGMDARKDELHLVGEIPDNIPLTENLKKFLAKVYPLNPVAEFNRAPMTQVKGLPFDLMTFYMDKRI